VYGDTPEIEALSTGFARKGYYNSGYEKARVFANVTTSKSLAAQIKPDGKHTPARYAYATGIVEPQMGGIFAVGTSAKELAEELNFKNPRALQTAFDKNLLSPDPSMPGTKRALLNGKPVFKFQEVAAVKAAQAPAAKALAAARHAFRTTPSNEIIEYARGVNDLKSILEGLERSVERATRYSNASSVTVKEFDAPVIKSSSRWV
jgi:hypothetical protein